ncbi:hypothetical protein B0H13DRAFT_2335426 [Mycena leptocephala]|nr:hypothetical protein B0H13DRAFT_2335426 [Mycena leptocephala]
MLPYPTLMIVPLLASLTPHGPVVRLTKLFVDTGAEAAAASGAVPGGKAILCAFGVLLEAARGVSDVYGPESDKLHKPKSSRRPPISDFFKLWSTDDWSVLKGRLRTNIRTGLELTTVNLTAYNITFTVPRQVTDPISLTNHTS